jgi:hypothetical protein
VNVIKVINSVRESVLIAVCIAILCLAAPALSFKELRADYACRALVIDPASAANLERPYALRYRSAPVRVCVPDDREPNGRIA